MAVDPFAGLPADLHASLQPGWTERLRPASALLGTSDGAPEHEVSSSILDLSDLALTATSGELAKYLKEREAAVSGFTSELARDARRKQYDADEGKIHELFAEHFDSKFLPLNEGTLQAIVESLARAERANVCSPLFTAWTDRLRQQGIDRPKLSITWPKELEREWVDLGEGMRDVDLTISGHARGSLGTKAVTCCFKVDEFEGTLLRNAEGCTVVGNVIDALVLSGARDSTVRCKELACHHLILSHGCKIEAKTAMCPTICAGKVAQDDKPCEVTIDHLFGSIQPGDTWKVNIGETTESPRPVQDPGDGLLENTFDLNYLGFHEHQDFKEEIPESYEWVLYDNNSDYGFKQVRLEKTSKGGIRLLLENEGEKYTSREKMQSRFGRFIVRTYLNLEGSKKKDE